MKIDFKTQIVFVLILFFFIFSFFYVSEIDEIPTMNALMSFVALSADTLTAFEVIDFKVKGLKSN